MLPIDMTPTSPYRILEADGLGPVAVSPQAIRSPGQRGVTAVDLAVPARVITLQFFSEYRTATEYWEKRRVLSRALVFEPPQPDSVMALGTLRLRRDGLPDREVLCLAQNAHIPYPKGLVGVIRVDVDFYCPSPYFQDAQDSTITLAAAVAGMEFANAGFQVDNVSGFVAAGNDVQQEVINNGDVSAPIVGRMYGDITTGRLRNITTGETIEVTGNTAAGYYIEVNTGFGTKKVELVNDTTGVRSSAMSRLNLALAKFWSLRPGSNIIRFEADANVSGRALLSWRQLYGGV